MSITVPLVNVSANATFSNLIDTVNQIANVISNYTLTVNTLANGSISTGNGFLNGIFGATTLVANSIRGGNIQSSGNLSFLSNVSFGLASFSNTIYLGNTSSLNSTTLFLGNSSVNAVLNSTSLYFNNVKIVTANSRASVQQNSVAVGIRGSINFITSGIVSVACVDNANTDSIDITLSAFGNSIVAGSDKQVQFNSNGTMTASLGLTFDKSTNTLAVANLINTEIVNTVSLTVNSITANSLSVPSVQLQNVATQTTIFKTSSTTSYELDSFTKASYTGGEYNILIKDSANSIYQISKLLLLFDGNTVTITEFGDISSNNFVFTDFTPSTNSTHVIITANSSASNTTAKIIKMMIS